MQALVMGNSHVGAVIQAYKDDNNQGDIQFLAVNGNSLLQNLKFDNKLVIYSEREHISEAIEAQGLEGRSLNDFDCVFVYGCQLRAAGSGEHWINKISAPIEHYSHQVRQSAHRDFTRETTHYRFLESFRSNPTLAHINLVSIPSPLPNELAPFCGEIDPVPPSRIKEVGDSIRVTIESLGVTYLDTPASLLSDNGYTSSAKFRVSREQDTAHLNRDGGQAVLNTIRQQIALYH